MGKFKLWKIVAAILIVLLLLFLIWKLISQPEKYFLTTEIKDNSIFNTVKERNYLDTLIYSGLLNMNMKNIVIVIKPITEQIKRTFSGELEVKAKITGEGNTYIVWIDPTLARFEYFPIVAHELIHLEQYYSKQLIVGTSTITWKGKNFIVENTPENYKSRPWEIAATLIAPILEQQMLTTLYGTN